MFAQDKLKLDKITLIGYILILLAITIGFVTRIVAVFQYVTFDIGPDPDQIRDAFTVMKIWQGEMPTLGPSSTVGGYHILPLYYYLFFPFTLLGANPAFQAFPNALFSFLSILLLIYLVYELLENIPTPKRIFLGGLAGFWYSVIFGEIFISNYQWNPCSIPFFILIFTLLFKLQMESRKAFLFSAVLWILYGITLAILISLHSAALFVMPLVFIISSLIFLIPNFRKKKKLVLLLPVLAIFSTLITLLPYWIGEINRGFSNTKLIIKTVITSSGSNESGLLMNLWEKIYRILSTYFELGQQAYFFGESWFYLVISIIFMSVVTYLGITKFRGNKNIWYIFCITWIVYLYAASNLDQTNFIFYYKLLILFAPIILTIVSLGYLDYSRTVNKIIAVFIGACIIFSAVTNLGYDYRFLSSKYGLNRLMNTLELTQLLRQIPENSTICDPKVQRKRQFLNQYNYIDNYITNRGLKVVSDCQKGHYVIHPKRVMLINGNLLVDQTYTDIYTAQLEGLVSFTFWPMFKVVDNEIIERKSQLFLETDTAYVYILD